jgi:uncharacterized membrane protein
VWSDDRVEQFIGRLLRIGVLTAAAVVLAGAAAFLAHVGHTPANFLIFRDDHTEIGSIGAIVRRALAGDSRAIVQMGLVLLMATPIARVALTLVAFALQRDRLYVAITALVLALLVSGCCGIMAEQRWSPPAGARRGHGPVETQALGSSGVTLMPRPIS